MYLLFLLVTANAFLQLNFTVLQGNSDNNSNANSKLQLYKRYDEVTITNEQLFYVAEIQIGSNNQSIGVILDTSLPFLIVPTHGCKKYKNFEIIIPPMSKKGKGPEIREELPDCTSAGLFNPSTLSTFRKDDPDQKFIMVKSPNILLGGYWGADFIQVGDYRVNMTFGVAEYSHTIGSFGLARRSGGSNSTSFPILLKQEGLVKSVAYSLLLGLNNASEGLILFGAVDHGKYDGILQKVKTIHTDWGGDVPRFSKTAIIMDGFLGAGFAVRDQTPVFIVTSVTRLKLQKSYVDKLHEYYNVTTDRPILDYYQVECAFLNLTDLFTFYFSGIAIEVPVRDLVFMNGGWCYLGVTEASGLDVQLGENFLRSAYVVYDFDNQEMALAQAAATESAATIEEIITLIPLALEAPYYNYTQIEDYQTNSDFSLVIRTSSVDLPPLLSMNTELRSTALVTNTSPSSSKSSSVRHSGSERPLALGHLYQLLIAGIMIAI